MPLLSPTITIGTNATLQTQRSRVREEDSPSSATYVTLPLQRTCERSLEIAGVLQASLPIQRARMREVELRGTFPQVVVLPIQRERVREQIVFDGLTVLLPTQRERVRSLQLVPAAITVHLPIQRSRFREDLPSAGFSRTVILPTARSVTREQLLRGLHIITLPTLRMQDRPGEIAAHVGPFLKTAREIARLYSVHPWLRLDAYLGVVPYGSGQVLDCDAYLTIPPDTRWDVSLTIPPDTIDPPTNPLAVHLGQGVLLFGWTPPSFANPALLQYEIYASDQISGNYLDLLTNLSGNRATFRGVPLGITAYFKIRAVHPSGLKSTFAQFKLGKVQPGSFSMAITSIYGSRISQGAVFTMIDPATGSLTAFKALKQIDIID